MAPLATAGALSVVGPGTFMFSWGWGGPCIQTWVLLKGHLCSGPLERRGDTKSRVLCWGGIPDAQGPVAGGTLHTRELDRWRVPLGPSLKDPHKLFHMLEDADSTRK